MKIAKEGYPFILTVAGLALLAFLGGWAWIGWGFALLALAFLGFFRDPERIAPEGEGLVVSPADGRVTAIRDLRGEGLRTRVSIFLSPLDVHINRSPVEGKVEEVRYQAGKFFAAYKEEASEANERNAVTLVDKQGRRFGVVQIAGVVARRIVCKTREGDWLERGQRFGLIRFGSRVDLFVPDGSRVEVIEGQRVTGGETIIARMV
ncbi:MAG: phosphatidylserine decarboxylase [Deltaproteobacteria bacterium RIFCSPLOWO2_12_FULL_60_19]|nr:MAG: phosphatidylserine decarboxylase [Deltaproteobacteria bacterium RIFCSPLOWO2_12_FULL_60_19]